MLNQFLHIIFFRQDIQILGSSCWSCVIIGSLSLYNSPISCLLEYSIEAENCYYIYMYIYRERESEKRLLTHIHINYIVNIYLRRFFFFQFSHLTITVWIHLNRNMTGKNTRKKKQKQSFNFFFKSGCFTLNFELKAKNNLCCPTKFTVLNFISVSLECMCLCMHEHKKSYVKLKCRMLYHCNWKGNNFVIKTIYPCLHI